MSGISHGFFTFRWLRGLQFLPPFFFRLFLAPILWIEGSTRLGLFKGDYTWWNPMTWIESGAYEAGVQQLSAAQGLLPIPLPSIMNGVFGGIEIAAAVIFLIGYAVRWISLPLLGVLILMALSTFSVGGDLVGALKDFVMSFGYHTAMTDGGFASTLTIFLMVLSLFFTGAGFFSFDWIHEKLHLRKRKKKLEVNTHVDDPFEG